MIKDLAKEIQKIKATLAPFKSFIKRRARGELPYDYLVPSGYYQEQWDWDAFFMGVGLAAEIPSEAIYLRNWALNYFYHADKNGYSPGCITPKGPETGHRAILMKPFIAQGSYFAAKFLNDFSWIEPYYETLRAMTTYREHYLWSSDYDLGVWTNSMESGVDNNVAVLGFPSKSVVAADLNTYIYREYKALSLVAKALKKKTDARYFSQRALTIKKNLNRYLWNKEDEIYYNIYTKTREHIKRISFSSFIPLWGKLASVKRGKATIKRYMLSFKHLWCKYGLRTLSKSDPDYNNRNIIKPHSNWQGPVWPIANYIYMHGLLNYGFQSKAIEVARKTARLVIKDINQSGGMHENYNAETGKPLAAPNFVSWNILISNMLEEAVDKKNSFAI